MTWVSYEVESEAFSVDRSYRYGRWFGDLDLPASWHPDCSWRISAGTTVSALWWCHEENFPHYRRRWEWHGRGWVEDERYAECRCSVWWVTESWAVARMESLGYELSQRESLYDYWHQPAVMQSNPLLAAAQGPVASPARSWSTWRGNKLFFDTRED